MASGWLSCYRLWVSRSEESSPGIKLSAFSPEFPKVTSTLGLCNFVHNYTVCFYSLFSVYSLKQRHISAPSTFSWMHLCLMHLCVSLEVIHDKLVQLVEYHCALNFPTYFMVVPTKLLPSFKNGWRKKKKKPPQQKKNGWRNMCTCTPKWHVQEWSWKSYLK